MRYVSLVPVSQRNVGHTDLYQLGIIFSSWYFRSPTFSDRSWFLFLITWHRSESCLFQCSGTYTSMIFLSTITQIDGSSETFADPDVNRLTTHQQRFHEQISECLSFSLIAITYKLRIDVSTLEIRRHVSWTYDVSFVRTRVSTLNFRKKLMRLQSHYTYEHWAHSYECFSIVLKSVHLIFNRIYLLKRCETSWVRKNPLTCRHVCRTGSRDEFLVQQDVLSSFPQWYWWQLHVNLSSSSPSELRTLSLFFLTRVL